MLLNQLWMKTAIKHVLNNKLFLPTTHIPLKTPKYAVNPTIPVVAKIVKIDESEPALECDCKVASE